ncbi:hypothetical protein B0H14DRAFT_2577133 [Mycena olivaceomarginata]|nr:hypothetical protein B0H14DRAFT_2577133 [Mycena olivaceomarginata]
MPLVNLQSASAPRASGSFSLALHQYLQRLEPGEYWEAVLCTPCLWALFPPCSDSFESNELPALSLTDLLYVGALRAPGPFFLKPDPVRLESNKLSAELVLDLFTEIRHPAPLELQLSPKLDPVFGETEGISNVGYPGMAKSESRRTSSLHNPLGASLESAGVPHTSGPHCPGIILTAFNDQGPGSSQTNFPHNVFAVSQQNAHRGQRPRPMMTIYVKRIWSAYEGDICVTLDKGLCRILKKP